MKDEAAFSAFCLREHARLVGALGLYCSDPDLAEELAQEVLIRACRDWRKVKKMEFPAAWLHRVGINMANSYFRRKVVERRAKQLLDSAHHERHIPPDDTESLHLRWAIDSLPSRQKTAIVLRFFVDLPVNEVAVAMKCSPGSAKTQIRKGIENLRRKQGIKEAFDVG